MAEEKMTIDDLAAMSQREFALIRETMATKEEMRALKVEILDAINSLGLHITSWQSDWDGRFKDLEHRMVEVEKKVGIRQL